MIFSSNFYQSIFFFQNHFFSLVNCRPQLQYDVIIIQQKGGNKQMSKAQNTKRSRENKKQINEIYSDPTNIFIIENPQVLPPLTQVNKNILKDLLHSTNITGFKFKSNDWVNKITQDLSLNQMLIRIKQVNSDNQILPKFQVKLHPASKKFSLNHFISNTSVQTSATFYNLTTESIKNFTTFLKWNYRNKTLSSWGQLKLWAPWIIELGQKWGSPINNRVACDCRIFSLKYMLNQDSQRKGRINESEQRSDILFLNLKGYQTRLKRTQIQMAGNYLNEQDLKKIDILETGFAHAKILDYGLRSYRYKLTLGSDYYSTWYLKLKAQGLKVTILNSYLSLMSFGQLGIIEGKNVIPHEMFSRNQTKWMGDRSRIFGHCRFDLFAKGIQFLELLNIYPSNYLSFWISKSFDKKIKLEGELGISFKIAKTSFRLDFNFLRLAGVKGEPRFGLKYQF